MRTRFGLVVIVSGCLALTAMPGWGGRGPGGGMGGGGTTTVYDAQFTSVHFSGSGNCGVCHNGLSDFAGADVSIEKSWSSAMMANSTRDPLWRAKLRSELNRNPALAAVINDKCTKCHAPMANTEAHYLGDFVSALDGGFLDPVNLHYSEAMDGVSCTLCHQVKDSPLLGTLAGFSGGYEIETFADPIERRIYGQYANVMTQPMRINVQYTPLYSAHVHQSKVCAVCHNLKTPYVDENGVLLSTTPETEFAEQMPYSEWEHSAFAGQQSCQDCHMPRTDGVVISSRPMRLTTRRDNFAIHQFAGANLLMLDILDVNRQSLGVTSNNFPYTIAETTSLLQGAGAIELLQGSLAGEDLDIRLKILSHTGHKLPSGIPLRRIILHLRVLDTQGETVFESGRINPDGSVAGVDSDLDPALFEPHHELITSQDQVQVYEAVMKNSLGEVTYTLLRAMDYVKDNRLLPLGFDKATAGPDIKVAGAALEDGNFLGGSDEVGFRVGGLTGQRYTVIAELVFQPLAYPVVRDLSQDDDAEIIAFRSMFDASGKKSTVIGSLQFEVSR